MATPEVAGAAALLLQRHPSWTVEEVKSALVSTGAPVKAGGHRGIDVARGRRPHRHPRGERAAPLHPAEFARLGTRAARLRRHTEVSRPWTRAAARLRGRVSVAPQSLPAGAKLKPAPTSLVAGADAQAPTHGLEAREPGRRHGLRRAHARQRRAPRAVLVPRRGPEAPARSAPDADSAGRLQRRHGRRAVARLDVPLPAARRRARGSDTARRTGGGLPVPAAQAGRELRRRHPRPGSHVSPRLVRNDDENQLDGYTGLPATLNPYGNFGDPAPVVGAVLPTPGVYDFVFDTPTGTRPGAFKFRFWINDTTPPSITLLDADGHRGEADSARRARRGRRRRSATRISVYVGATPGALHVRARDAVDPDLQDRQGHASGSRSRRPTTRS